MRIVKLRSWSGQSQTVRVRISTNGSWLNEPKRLLDAIDYCYFNLWIQRHIFWLTHRIVSIEGTVIFSKIKNN